MASLFTRNVMPNSKHERGRQGPRQDNEQSRKLISSAGINTQSGLPSLLALQPRLSYASAVPFHFLPSPSPFDQGDSERLAFIPSGTGPPSWPFSMEFLFSGTSGPGPWL